MDINYLVEYANPIILGICLIVGFLVKTLQNRRLNQFIPIIVAVCGVALTAWIHAEMTAPLLLEGLVSGLSSTGCYEAFRNLFNLAEESEGENDGV